jgi:hypothetical protein
MHRRCGTRSGGLLGELRVNAIEGRDGVLNVASLRASQERYYLELAASGVGDYYLASAEEPGQRTGRVSELLDVNEVVEAEL